MELVEIHELAEKKKWMKRFRRAFKNSGGGDPDLIYSDLCRFFVTKDNGHELGFIRINNKTKFWKDEYDFEVWNAADGFVKRQHRGKGVLKFMLKNVIENHQVKMCCLHSDQYSKHLKYYRDLGFVSESKGKDSELYWLYQKDINPYL